MKITKIEIQKKNNKRYNIYVDEIFELGVDENVLIKCGLYVDQTIDSEFITNIVLKEEQSKGNHYAINLISYRMRSEKEVIDKMRIKNYEFNIIDNTIQFLYENNLLNDLNFSLMFLRDKTSLNRHSLKRIKYDLKNKGVSNEIINNAINLYLDENDDPDFENARYLSLKKYHEIKARKKSSSLTEYEIKQKTYQAIVIKGFNIYTVKDALEDGLLNLTENDFNIF